MMMKRTLGYASALAALTVLAPACGSTSGSEESTAAALDVPSEAALSWSRAGDDASMTLIDDAEDLARVNDEAALETHASDQVSSAMSAPVGELLNTIKALRRLRGRGIRLGNRVTYARCLARCNVLHAARVQRCVDNRAATRSMAGFTLCVAGGKTACVMKCIRR